MNAELNGFVRSKGAAAYVLAQVLALVVALPAGAVDFVVSSNGDQSDVLPGNGFCSTSIMFASCTLRAAVEEANALPGSDRVLVGSRTISVGSELSVTENLAILGDGASDTVVQALNANRIFDFEPSVGASLYDLTIRGVATVASGAVRNAGALVVLRVHFRDNEALNCGALWATGGGSTTIYNSTFSNNRASAIGGLGGAMCIDGSTVEVYETTFVGNSATLGGAIAMWEPGVSSSSLLIQSSTVAHHADSQAGPAPASSAFYADSGLFELRQSIVIGTCDYNGGSAITDGVNAESPGASCLPGGPDDQSNLTTQQLALGELADYGGPVPTMLPGTQSVAVDPVRNWLFCQPLDARGEPRQNSCDVGAVERQPDDPESGPIFVDGFESGGAGAWSSSSP